jgi:hypothetical protein
MSDNLDTFDPEDDDDSNELDLDWGVIYRKNPKSALPPSVLAQIEHMDQFGQSQLGINAAGENKGDPEDGNDPELWISRQPSKEYGDISEWDGLVEDEHNPDVKIDDETDLDVLEVRIDAAINNLTDRINKKRFTIIDGMYQNKLPFDFDFPNEPVNMLEEIVKYVEESGVMLDDRYVEFVRLREKYDEARELESILREKESPDLEVAKLNCTNLLQRLLIISSELYAKCSDYLPSDGTREN